MRWFQFFSAFVLIIAIAGVIWINRSPLPQVELIYIQESGYSVENNTFIKHLTEYIQDHKHLTLSIVDNDPEALSKSTSTLQGSQKVLLGCFTGTCKMQVLDAVKDTITPFIFLGRSHGLVQHPNLWHLGPIFSQKLGLLLPLIKGRKLESVHLLGEQNIDSHMSHYILKQYMKAIDYQWGRALLMTKNNEDVIADIIESTSNDLYINTACADIGKKIFKWIDDSLQKGIHTCLDPMDSSSQSQHFFITSSPQNQQSQMLTSWIFVKEILDSQIDRPRWSLDDLSAKQFSRDAVRNSMHIQNQHMWHNQYLIMRDGENVSVVKKIESVEPIVFPELRPATHWDLQMRLYWRNKNGRWQSI
ncbi:hypothetical protein HF888_04370 [Bermanella marisrubri]|uniref:Uncharacterized protein n=1 Tax=Bermanella marisrubri TaxID=207949 RepID=Q1N1M0_9GAMM|nr:hypothetical protein [Bermanella marisrubri]EAT12030.1 hypothetical protein RED65_03290 [Oceanobacter sp. RED65] [Bermanella marisrubri]QIZ83503.1 hypothetical protein HF888_04370 [Bermanella marisrubri]